MLLSFAGSRRGAVGAGGSSTVGGGGSSDDGAMEHHRVVAQVTQDVTAAFAYRSRGAACLNMGDRPCVSDREGGQVGILGVLVACEVESVAT